MVRLHQTIEQAVLTILAIAQVVIDLPLVAVQVTIFDIVVYFMSNLSRTPSQFFISWLILWVLTLSIYSLFRAAGAWCPSLDVATRFTGVTIQALVVYTGYLIPPKTMRPWLSWLRWINPVQYAFEALMANEFYNLKIQCVPPMLVPLGPLASPNHQSCTVVGSQPDEPFVIGSSYILIAYSYSRAHLWRNIGIIIGFWIFFVIVTAVGMEFQKPNAGGGAVTIFKRGEEPKFVAKALNGGKDGVADEEKGQIDGNDPATTAHQEPADSGGDQVKGVAANETIFTFQNVSYTIPYEKGQKKLLQNVNGYVKPGNLTALMGASGSGKTTLLNALAQRLTMGVVGGDFLVDGKSLPRSFQRSTGFAEQDDIHEPTSTVREAFRFSALLRQPKEVPTAEKYEYVEKIIDLLEMQNIASATIGKIGEGLNLEQRKRVTIGVELASKPELLLFLDEPVSEPC
jgi:ATP-binding cassette subfamily G (WHITE) protein 2 (SNQ2)